MPDIDSLDIRIDADASKAADAIGVLTSSLEELGRQIAPAATGLNQIADALSRVVANKSGLSGLSKSFTSLSKSWTGLSAVTKKSGADLTQISAKAQTMSQTIAKEWGIKDKEAINSLSTAIEHMYKSLGDNVQIGRALDIIDSLIKRYSSFKVVASESAKSLRDFFREQKLGLTESIKGRKDLFEIMGQIGTKNFSPYGSKPEEWLSQYNAKMAGEMYDPQKDYSRGAVDFSKELGDEEALLLKIRDLLQGAKTETLSFGEITGAAGRNLGVASDYMGKLSDTLEHLAQSAGTSSKGAMDAFGDVLMQVTMVSREAGESLTTLDNAVENLEATGNPLEGLVEGLQSLQGLQLSDSLSNITYIKQALGTFGGEYAGRAGTNISGISQALRELDGVTIPDFGGQLENLATGLSKLGYKKVGNAPEYLNNIKTALSGLNTLTVSPDLVNGIANLGKAIYQFGLAKMDKAAVNIPNVTKALSDMISSLSNMPQVSENTIRLVEAMGNMNVHAGNLNRSVGGLNNRMKGFTGHALNARKASMSLAQAFGKLYANFFIVFRLFRRFKEDVGLASALTEVQNVVDVTFADMTDKMNSFAKTAIDTLGMSELTAKQVGSRFQAMGNAMNITPAMVKSTNDFVQNATKGYAEVADSMADVSINLTRLAGDMASFYNAEYADVAKDLEAVMTGMTRPLRKYGLDLTNATLKEWAMRNGMEANMKTMTQAEKTMLRYAYVMANTTAAHGDFQRTISTWANQVRLASEKLNQLRIILGKIAIYTFKPLVQNFNNAMNQILKGAEGLLNALGKIFGWQVEWSDAGIIGDESDDAGELADNMGDAADNAKKFKNFLLGIDELNLLPDDKNKDKGGAGGLGDLTGDFGELGKFNIKPIEKGFESIYDTLYKLGRRINEVMKDLLKSIDWDRVYKKARRFGRGFAEFVNGLYSDAETFYELGKFFAGGVNTIANALDAYHKELNGYQRGVDIGSFINGLTGNLDWNVIKSAAYGIAHDLAQTINGALFTTDWKAVGDTLAEGLNTAVKYFYTLGAEINWGLLGDSIADGINGFFSTFDFGKVAETINAWAEGILVALYNALDKTDWNKVGKKLGEFLRKLNVTKIAAGLSKVLIKAFNAAADVFASSLAQAPLETALLGAIAVIKPQNIGIAFSQLFKSAFNFVDKKTIVDGIKNLLSGLPISLPKMLLGGGAGLAEFFVLKDTFKDLKLGAESFGGALAKIGTTALAAGGVMTAVFGFPAGTIAAGVIGITGALVGAVEGMAELQREADKIELGNILSNGGIGVGDYFKNAANDMRSAYENYGKMASEIEKTDFSGLKQSIQTDMQEIGFAIETLGTNLGDTSKTVEQKLADLEKLFENFKNDISRLFGEEISVIEQAGMNGLIDNVAQTTAMAHNLDLGVQKQIDAIKAKMDEARRLFEENGKNGVMTYSYEEYQGIMQNYWNQLNAIYSAVADSGMDKIAETASSIDFSKFFLGEENIDSVQASLEEFSTIYDNAISDLETSYDGLYEALTTLGEQASALGDDPAALEFAKGIQNAQEKEVKLIQEANADYITKIEEIERQAWEQIGVIISNPNQLAPQDVQNQVSNYVNSVLVPLESAITTETEKVGITWGSSMSSLASQLQDEMNSSLGGMAVEGGKMYGTDIFALWKERFADATLSAEKSINNLATTESVASKQAEEFAKSQGILSKAIKLTNENANDTQKAGKTSAAAYSDANREIARIRDTSNLAFSSVADFSKMLKDTGKSGDGIKEISTNFTALKATFGTFGAILTPIKTGFTEFAMQAQSNMTNTSMVFGQSFNSIMKYGNQTIAWLKSSFVPYFSGAYWNSITASIPNAFGNAFRQAISMMQSLWKQFAQWANENMKINAEVTKGSKGPKVEVNIPKYATGGFPEDGMFMANHGEMVGSFANGKTAVANNEQIVEGIRQGVYEAVMAAMQGSNGNVTVELMGDAADIFTAVVKENNRSIMRTGASPIRV